MLEILQKYWGYAQFRPLQKEIIEAVLQKNDVLAILPTGGGKSVCFQVPALAQDGVCLVVCPLIALMKDQVEQLKARKIPAEAIFTGMNQKEIDLILENTVSGKNKFLYISPERLKNEVLLARVKGMKITLLAIDEAHCISQWGYDFRPAYLEIAKFREQIPQVPCIALTATATIDVRNDIQKQLNFKNAQVFQKSFTRNNLAYHVRNTEDKEGKLLEILKKIQGSGIVYVATRRKTKEISDFLQKNNISADFYHAGLTTAERNAKQENWIKNRTRIIVATNAFGMGIDKADVRIVVHFEVSSSIEAYYQEAGRAGRDEKKAFAVALFHQKELLDYHKQIENAYPKPEIIKKVYQNLANHYQIAVGSHNEKSYDFDWAEFAKKYAFDVQQAYYSLKILAEQGFIALSEAFYSPSRLHFLVNKGDLYAFQVANRQFDEFFKVLLRIYGAALFTQFVNISENKIAQNLSTSVEQVKKYLYFLDKSNVLIYSPQKDKAQVSFLGSRFDAPQLPLDQKKIAFSKNTQIQKLEAFANYLQNNYRCRSILLSEYFGEFHDNKCGVCDVCLLQKSHISQKENILKLLSQENMLPKALKNALDVSDERLLAEDIKALLAEGKIRQNQEGFLEKI